MLIYKYTTIDILKKQMIFWEEIHMKEKILAIVITSIIVPVILIIIFTISSIKEKSRNGEKVNNFVDEVKEFDLGTLAWVIILVMLVCIIKLLIGY